MRCAAEVRARVRAVERVAAGADARLEAADVIRPADGETACWGIELTLKPGAGGCPPTLQRELAARGLTVRDVSPQGLFWHVTATA